MLAEKRKLIASARNAAKRARNAANSMWAPVGNEKATREALAALSVGLSELADVVLLLVDEMEV